jgi:Na+-transporting NADH:ubiquinone oxidoreductase subunit NqrB
MGRRNSQVQLAAYISEPASDSAVMFVDELLQPGNAPVCISREAWHTWKKIIEFFTRLVQEIAYWSVVRHEVHPGAFVVGLIYDLELSSTKARSHILIFLGIACLRLH